MNFLTHLYFSSDSIDNTRGLIIGNTAKGNHLAGYNLEILKGIAIDMQIRSFSENNSAFISSTKRINSRYISYAPFLVNIFYDHFLAKNWEKYSSQELEEFAKKIYSAIINHRNTFPYEIRKFALEMIENKWITGLRSLEGTHQYINSVSKNKKLDLGLFELMENYHHFNNDFEEYFVALCRFMEEEAQTFNAINIDRNFPIQSLKSA